VSDLKTAATGANPAQKLVTELKVSANLMTLDTGLYCIFNAPGGPAPDGATGLPGVRVSLPPGPVFRPEVITIQAFREDGWLGGWNGAALVRVGRGPAQILVTIYQAPNSASEAPRLQILRLADAAALPPLGAQAQSGAPRPMQGGPQPAVAAAPPAAANAAPAADKAGEITAHVQGRGDVSVGLSDWMGEPDSKRWIEGFALSPKGPVGPADIEYQAVLGRGWLSPWAEGGQYCGSRGMSLPILGLRIRLRGDAAERYDCVVESTFVDGTKLAPSDNGEPCQAESLAPLEAFRVKIVERSAAAEAVQVQPGQPAKPGKTTKEEPAAKPARKAPAPAPAKTAPRKK
jgi:hypothetical protein